MASYILCMLVLLHSCLDKRSYLPLFRISQFWFMMLQATRKIQENQQMWWKCHANLSPANRFLWYEERGSFNQRQRWNTLKWWLWDQLFLPCYIAFLQLSWPSPQWAAHTGRHVNRCDTVSSRRVLLIHFLSSGPRQVSDKLIWITKD